ncbi:MAG: DUF389 domain-containing protein [Candidatus Paceibacterota bacterium]
MLLGVFENVENTEKKEAIENLIRASSPRQDFFLMVILSISMATFGIILDSLIILIGSMLIAPVLYPVLGVGMGTAILDRNLLVRSAYTLAQSVVIALLYAVLLALLFTDTTTFSTELVERMATIQSFALYFFVSFVAGLAASFSLVKPQLSESLPGVAISVSLVPPLALAGIAGAAQSLTITGSMLLLFGVNILGVVTACTLVFLFMDLHVTRSVARSTLKDETKEIKEEGA